MISITNYGLFCICACVQALEFPMPHFAHVSLILAPDRSKLSKRHGATSVGQVGLIHHFHILYFIFLKAML